MYRGKGCMFVEIPSLDEGAATSGKRRRRRRKMTFGSFQHQLVFHVGSVTSQTRTGEPGGFREHLGRKIRHLQPFNATQTDVHACGVHVNKCMCARIYMHKRVCVCVCTKGAELVPKQQQQPNLSHQDQTDCSRCPTSSLISFLMSLCEINEACAHTQTHSYTHVSNCISWPSPHAYL